MDEDYNLNGVCERDLSYIARDPRGIFSENDRAEADARLRATPAPSGDQQ